MTDFDIDNPELKIHLYAHRLCLCVQLNVESRAQVGAATLCSQAGKSLSAAHVGHGEQRTMIYNASILTTA